MSFRNFSNDSSQFCRAVVVQDDAASLFGNLMVFLANSNSPSSFNPYLLLG